jgi:hypothetical protein
MTCASGAAVSGTLALADGREGASSTKPRALACELGGVLSGRALVGDGRAVVGRAVSGQSLELEDVFFEDELDDEAGGRFVAAGSPTGRAVSGQSLEDDAEGRVVVSFRGAKAFVVVGGGLSAALARAARAAALFGSNRGGSVGFLT